MSKAGFDVSGHRDGLIYSRGSQEGSCAPIENPTYDPYEYIDEGLSKSLTDEGGSLKTGSPQKKTPDIKFSISVFRQSIVIPESLIRTFTFTYIVHLSCPRKAHL